MFMNHNINSQQSQAEENLMIYTAKSIKKTKILILLQDLDPYIFKEEIQTYMRRFTLRTHETIINSLRTKGFRKSNSKEN